MHSNITVQYPQAYVDENDELNGIDPTCDLCFNEYGAMFSLESRQPYREGEVEAYCCARQAPDMGPNQAWVLNEFVDLLVNAGVVEMTKAFEGVEVVYCTDESEEGKATLCDIVHPNFNDGGYSPFGDFCRSRLKQQCQYGSRYIDGRIEGYPALGDGLRFNNGRGYNGLVRELKASDYHNIRIHRDDMDEFESRYHAYFEEKAR